MLTCFFLLLHTGTPAQEQKNSPALNVIVPLPGAASGQPQVTLPPGQVAGENTRRTIDAMPEPGYDISQYISKNSKYPRSDKRKGIGGKAVVQFVVDKTGQVRDVVLLASVAPKIDAEALRIVKNMPRWKSPGMLGGKPVLVRYTLKISFSANE